MQRCRDKLLLELALQLRFTPERLRVRQLGGAERLLAMIEDGREYPYEFVVYQITGYRPKIHASHLVTTEQLRQELPRFIEQLSVSVKLRPENFDEAVYTIDDLSRRYRVSPKTITRWRSRGLVARRFVFADGYRRVGFLESSVQHFVNSNADNISRGSEFSRLDERQREDILHRARALATAGGLGQQSVCERIAHETNRAVETIRTVIRNHNRENPKRAIFPPTSDPLTESAKAEILRRFSVGESVSRLARRFGRTRSSVYRVVVELRAAELASEPVDYIYSDQFDLPYADELILSETPEVRAQEEVREHRHGRSLLAEDLPHYLRQLSGMPLLNRQLEMTLFRRMNYLRHKAEQLRRALNKESPKVSAIRKIEYLIVQSDQVKQRIVGANLRLVVSIAKRHAGTHLSVSELVSEGNLVLMKAVAKFNYSLGNKFSTYASWALMKHYARAVPQEHFRRDRFRTGSEELITQQDEGEFDAKADEIFQEEVRRSISSVLSGLDPRERTIVVAHYGLDPAQESITLKQIGMRLDLSKERVRQIEARAMKKLRQQLPSTLLAVD